MNHVVSGLILPISMSVVGVVVGVVVTEISKPGGSVPVLSANILSQNIGDPAIGNDRIRRNGIRNVLKRNNQYWLIQKYAIQERHIFN